jgi:hypothetical protein
MAMNFMNGPNVVAHRQRMLLVLMVFLISQLLGCSFKKIAVHSLANALTEGSNNAATMSLPWMTIRNWCGRRYHLH